MDKFFRYGTKYGKEVAILIFLINMGTNAEEIEIVSGASSKRIKEIYKGIGLIGKNILESSARSARALLLEKIVDISRMFTLGRNVDEIVGEGYEEPLVFQVYQALFCVNEEEKK